MTSLSRYTYVWEFHIAPDSCARFEAEYGPDGSWVTLFRAAPGYIDTMLLRDISDPLRYVTIDFWNNQQDYMAFRRNFASQYEAIDRQCAELTTRERLLGEFSAEF